jgi:ubiquinol-cytochrome c reductase cytochrome b subunit
VALVVAHVALFRKHGVTPGANADRSVVHNFYPRQAWMDLAASLVVFGVVLFLAYRDHGAPLDAPADPASDYPARPEWYFLPLFELLKYFHGAAEVVGTLVVPALAAGYLFSLPLFDRAPGTALTPRLKVLTPLFLGAIGAVVLTANAIRADKSDPKFQAARAVADTRARVAIELAKEGVPVEGPLAMLRNDPELRGHAIFERSCSPCHVLGDLGERAKATAPVLNGWGTEAWVLGMLHDPDAPERFGNTPYKGEMPSMDTPPKEGGEAFKPMPSDDMQAAAAFLISQGDERGEAIPANALRHDPARVKRGEAIVTNRCTACHMWRGDGDVGGTENAPELYGYGSIAWTRAQVTNPGTPATYRPGATGPNVKEHMPAFEAELSAADIDVVARWTRAHARGVPLTR